MLIICSSAQLDDASDLMTGLDIVLAVAGEESQLVSSFPTHPTQASPKFSLWRLSSGMEYTDFYHFMFYLVIIL